MGGFDALDVGILRNLVQGQGLAPLNPHARLSWRAISTRLGVSEGTVRNRVLRFHETGFIREVRLIPNPTLFGLAQACLMFDVPRGPFREELVGELSLLEDVVVLANFHGSLLSPIIRYRDEADLARQVELIRRLAKVDRMLGGRLPFPPSNVRLASSDWSVLRAFHRDPGRTYSSVAREVRLSSRTVKGKLQRMLRENTAFVWQALDPAKLRGASMGALIVEYPLEAKEHVDHVLTTRFAEHIYHVLHMLPFRAGDLAPCGYNFIVPNVPRAHEMLHEARGLSEVRSARVELHEDVLVNYRPSEEDLAKGPA